VKRTRALYQLVVENVRSGTTPGEHRDPPARYEIQNRETTVGRSPECTIRLDDIFVSRRHARLVLRDVELQLEDLESTNQSRVNGAPVPTRVRIHPGDRLLFGGARCHIESLGEVDAGDAAGGRPAGDERAEPEAAVDATRAGTPAPEAAGAKAAAEEELVPWPPAEPPQLHVAGPLAGEPRRARRRLLAVVLVALAVLAAVLFLR
jgi:predicted component of type VI protein secretion system